MTRRDRIRLIYHRWSILCHMRWLPGTGWLPEYEVKTYRLGQGYVFTSQELKQSLSLTPEREAEIIEILRSRMEAYERSIFYSTLGIDQPVADT